MDNVNKIPFRNIVDAQRKRHSCTLLGLGPMSKNCVDTIIEVANERLIPILLIPSRRQVECEEFGGGYVNRWSTESFAEYVKKKDKFGYVILCRDHGGPWQNTFEKEKKYSLDRAMESAKRSYEIDILSDFKVIHLDPSVDPKGDADLEEIFRRLFELLDFCVGVAQKNGKEIYFEVGTEETDGQVQDPASFKYFVKRTSEYCEKNGYDLPVFAVGQTGTLVKETRNVGTFQYPFRTSGVLPPEIHIPKLVEICEAYGLLLKEHNTDYLPDEVLDQHPKFGIHSANVAPQLGVAETMVIINTCDELGVTEEKREFLELSLESQRWVKWMVPNSTADDYQKAIIAGHYVFSTPEFLDMKAKMAYKADRQGIDIDARIRGELRKLILNFANRFNLLNLEVDSG